MTINLKRIIHKLQRIKADWEQKRRQKRELTTLKSALRDVADFLHAQQVHILNVELPIEWKINNLSDFERERIDSWEFDFNKYREEQDKLRLLYGRDITEEYILSLFDGGVVVQGEKRKILLDFESEHQHIINGRRLTLGNPLQYHNNIYIHGACTWRGTGVEDKDTIPSILQSHINELMPNQYRVLNSAIGRGSTIYDDIQFIREQQYIPGDIVIIGSHGLIWDLDSEFFRSIGIEYVETSSLFHRPHNYGEWFNDHTLHTNCRGNKVIGQCLFQKLVSLSWLEQSMDHTSRKPPMPQDATFLTQGERIYGDNPDLLKYIESLQPFKKGLHNGCIVMNCNPFTLGHRYLIEYAASLVDYLYIFVVEENRSFFTFDDRFDLVCKGTADLENVIVVPSGNFIISATTFPGYFYKDNLKEVKIDCSNDLRVFAQYIAPSLNIKIRFAGEEPLDPVTNQYNEGMKEILPQYGIEFCAIPRKKDEAGVGVISASRVRNLLEAQQFDEISKIVPPTTLEYLQTNFRK